MQKKIPVTAIFDIGKTNKKFLLFDEDYSVVYENKIRIEETVDDDGYPADDLGKITEWVMYEFDKVVSGNQFHVETLNFTTYGATMVHLDEEGKPVTPLYNYLKPYPAELANQFFETYGGEETFSLETASPPMGMLNSGLQLYWLKHQKPLLFRRIKQSLHLPQYIAALFTGKAASEMTSIGCHTAMWNFRTNGYHRWLEEEGLKNLLPPIQPVRKTQKIRYNDHILEAGIGIHDSSAALAPYLVVFDEPFIQLSTGTWSIAMNPFNDDPLTFDELRRDCLQYITIFGKPVKASRFLLGGEYAHQVKKLGNYFGRNPDRFDCESNPELIRRIVNQPENQTKLVLEKSAGSGPYPLQTTKKWEMGQFEHYEEGAHQLLLDLASVQADALKLAEGCRAVDQIIITGGFAKNQFFCRLLASMMPGKSLFTADVTDASAFGAAVVVKSTGQKNDPIKQKLKLNKIEPYPGLNISHYSWEKM
ncbi:MAG: carbohydrate kinase [Balneolaceae bacterium]|nr:MAG: carbohydrate kinase [Balneolaceae bacterium]